MRWLSKQFETVSKSQEFSLEAQERSMDDHDDPLKKMGDNDQDDSAVDESKFYLNQLHKGIPDLASDKLDTEGLVGFDGEAETNKSRPFSAEEIVNEYLPQPVETVEDGSNDEDEVPD